jgi:hypothetical protein
MQNPYTSAVCLETFAGPNAGLIPVFHFDKFQLAWVEHQFYHRQRNTEVTPLLEA